MQHVFASAVFAELTKLAEDDGKGDSTWWERQKGAVRAGTEGGKNWRGIVGIRSEEDRKRMGKASWRGAAKGALPGAAVGGAAGAALTRSGKGTAIGAGLGALHGLTLGSAVAQGREQKKILSERGVNERFGGWKHRFTPEARKKYIEAYRKEK